MQSHPLTSFKIQKSYQSETRFNGAYPRNNSPKTKDGTYVSINMYIILGQKVLVSANQLELFG